jgi:hypothetical protein
VGDQIFRKNDPRWLGGHFLAETWLVGIQITRKNGAGVTLVRCPCRSPTPWCSTSMA